MANATSSSSKKRKSEGGATVVPVEEGSKSAQAVEMEVDQPSKRSKKEKKDKSEKGEKESKRKEKKDKKKTSAGDVSAITDGDVSMAVSAAGDTTLGVVEASEAGGVATGGKNKDGKKKEKKEKEEKPETPVLLENLTPIAHPLAGKKLTKNLYKVLKKASKARQLKRGVKEVTKALRKGDKGLLLLAGNITPVDVISHFPVMAEEANVDYCWVASKEELGAASGTKRATSAVLISSNPRKVKAAKGDAKAKGQAQTDEQVKEWLEPLKEVIAEVKNLDDAGVKY